METYLFRPLYETYIIFFISRPLPGQIIMLQPIVQVHLGRLHTKTYVSRWWYDKNRDSSAKDKDYGQEKEIID